MMPDFIIRISTNLGEKRFTMKPNDSISAFKMEIANMFGLSKNDIQLFRNSVHSTKFTFPDSSMISKCTDNGTLLFLKNKVTLVKPEEKKIDDKIKSNIPPSKNIPQNKNSSDFPQSNIKNEVQKDQKNVENRKDEMKLNKRNELEKDALKKMIPSQALENKKEGEKVEEDKNIPDFGKKTDTRSKLCSHGANAKCIHCISLSSEDLKKSKPKCNHSPEAMCINCMNIKEPMGMKHVSFDRFLKDLSLKCIGKHPVDKKCHLCVPPSQPSFKVNLNCKEHKPYPEGICNKCMPPNINLKRQEYRHIDYVEFLNKEELDCFIHFWQENYFKGPRVGFLIGYFAEDKTYPDGIRVIVEAIYEPPQASQENEFILLNDPDMDNVIKLASLWGFEIVGIIYTSNDPENIIRSKDMIRIAQLQEKYSYLHPCGIKVPKFVTTIFKLNENANEEMVQCYMVSDEFQALVRDNVFGEQKKPGVFVFKKPAEMELLPSVFINGQTVNEFPVDYFIVSVAVGSPLDKHDFNYIKCFGFPIENRNEPQTKDQIKKYVETQKRLGTKYWPSNFHFIICVAKLINPELAANIIFNILASEELDPKIYKDLISAK